MSIDFGSQCIAIIEFASNLSQNFGGIQDAAKQQIKNT